jgi:hypothetical protein
MPEQAELLPGTLELLILKMESHRDVMTAALSAQEV